MNFSFCRAPGELAKHEQKSVMHSTLDLHTVYRNLNVIAVTRKRTCIQNSLLFVSLIFN